MIDGVSIDVKSGYLYDGDSVRLPVTIKLTCRVKLAEFSDDIEAIKNTVKSFVFRDTCKEAEANWNMTNFVSDQMEELIRRASGRRQESVVGFVRWRLTVQ